MDFVLKDAAQYRAMSNEELELRRSDVVAELENPESTFTAEQMRSEVDMLKVEEERRKAAADLRITTRSMVAAGAGSVIATDKKESKGYVVDRAAEALSSPEYVREFAHYLSTRGAKLSPEFEQYQQRTGSSAALANPVGGVLADAGILVPLHIQQDIISQLEDRGVIWNAVNKTNVPGGIDYPIGNFSMTASWIGEKETSNYQVIDPITEKISFRYHQLEARHARTLMAEVISPEVYSRKYAESASAAMIDALESAILNGNGSGKPLGVFQDPRLTNVSYLAAADFTVPGYMDKVKNPIARLASGYRNGVLYMAETTFNYYFEGMVDQVGQPVARVNYGIDGEISRFLFGQRVICLDEKYIPFYDDAVADSKAFMLYGNLKNYTINSNLALRADRWEDYDNNLFKSRLIMIVDGKIVDNYGFIKFVAGSDPSGATGATGATGITA